MSQISRGLEYLVLSQTPKGGWDWNGRLHVLLSCRVLYALSRHGPTEGSTALGRGVDWLIGLQKVDGSWENDLDATKAAVVLLLRMGFSKKEDTIQKASKWILDNGEKFAWSYYLADGKRREAILARCQETLPEQRLEETEDSDLINFLLEGWKREKVYLDEINGYEGKNIFKGWMRKNESTTNLFYKYKKYGDGQLFIDESNSTLLKAAFLLDAIPKLSFPHPQNTNLTGATSRYLAKRQNQDGGWGYEAGEDSEVNPTAVITSALIRAESKNKRQ